MLLPLAPPEAATGARFDGADPLLLLSGVPAPPVADTMAAVGAGAREPEVQRG